VVQIIERVLAVQPEHLVRSSADHINTMLDACFKIKSQPTIATLASVLKKIHALFPPASPDNPAKVCFLLPTHPLSLFGARLPLHHRLSHMGTSQTFASPCPLPLPACRN